MVPGGSSEHLLVTAEIAVTSFHASPLGGGILVGRDEREELRRVALPAAAMGREPQPGEIWRITGPEFLHSQYGRQIQAQVMLPLLPSGRAIIRYLATSPRFPGIGWATATRLWEELGDGLYDAIHRNEAATIAAVIGSEKAVHVIQGFGLLAAEVEVFQWLDRYGVSPRTAVAAASIWGRGAIEKIKADPYALILLEPWRAVDARALRLGVAPTDRRRLLAAVEEALARRYRSGHTAATRTEVEGASLSMLLGKHAASQAPRAVDLAIETGRILVHGGLLQGRAAWFMEREVERMLRERLARERPALPVAEVVGAIADLEMRQAYEFAAKQREAILMATSSPLTVICGGAGTGKTSVVKAILDVFELQRASLPTRDQANTRAHQVALAGRAAKRITEATGRTALTIARFVRRLENGPPLKHGLIIFDEASMLDLPSVYRILTFVSAEVDLLFIGDPGQLPPIGPGQLLARMIQSNLIPRVELDVIHRQASGTGIPHVARTIREGRLPNLPQFDPERPLAPGIYIEPTRTGDEARSVLYVFRAMAGRIPLPGRVDPLHDLDIQILCPTKNGPAGTRTINREIEGSYMSRQPPVQDWGLAIGSKVLWLKNDYRKGPLRNDNGSIIADPLTGEPIYQGFMNGSLGIVRHQTANGAWIELDDGIADEIRIKDLELLTGGWAVSVHKAQGSAFRRVIMPITGSRLLDRTMIYTAVTRAVETVVLVGNPRLLDQIVATPPIAWQRRDGLMI